MNKDKSRIDELKDLIAKDDEDIARIIQGLSEDKQKKLKTLINEKCQREVELSTWTT